MINPAEIPQIPGDMAALGQHATAVSGVGTAFPDTGARVHSTWQGLAPVYVAPESAQLFAATGPVQSVSASVGEDLTAVGGALGNYATEVAAIKARLEVLRTQATAFVDGVANDDDWRKDQGKVDQHNQLLSDVNGAVADFMDAQRRCANAILSRYSDKRYTAENGDGTVTDTEFGYTKDVFDAALTQGDGLPWGKPEEHDRGFLGDVGAFFVGVKDGAVGFVEGLGALIGYSDGHWSWGTAGTAWKGLGTFALALSAPYLIPLNQATDLPGLPKGTLGNTLLGAGKSLIAYDTWKEDKSKAAGEATFNIVSAIVGTKGAGAGLRGAGAAAEASRFATVAKVGAGAVKAGEFITKLPKVSDVVLNTIKKFPGFKLPHIELPHTDIPTTHIDPPHIDASGGHVPNGPSVGDGVGHQHALPPAATITHDGVVDGRQFLDQPAPHTPEPSIVHDGVIGGTPHDAGSPAAHGADAPVHNAEPLPPGATITDRGIVPGGHGGPLADAGGGIHIDQDGVIRGGSPADAPVPHGAEAAGGAPVHGSGTPAAPTPHGADSPVTPAPHGADAPATGTPHGADAPVTPIPHGADTGAAPAPHGGDAAGTPAPHGAGTPAAHGAGTPATPGAHGADAPVHNTEPLPPGATITDKGIVPGGHGGGPLADAGAGIHIDRDGVIRPGTEAPVPHGADATGPAPHGGGTPATPTPHGADAPVHNAEPLPPGATITDKGIVPGGHGGGPLADAGAGIHIDRDGVIRPGAHADAPPPHTPQEPALVGAGERPLVQDGVIGGGRGSHIDNAAGGATHLPGHDPLIRDGVIGGGRGIDHTPPALHGEPGRPGGVHTDPPGGRRFPDDPPGGRLPDDPPSGGRLPDDPTVHPHDPSPHDPGAHDPATHDPGTHDPAAHDPGTHDPGTHDPATHDPGTNHDGANAHHGADDAQTRHAAAEEAARTPGLDHLFTDETPRVHPDALDGREIEAQDLGTLRPELLGHDANGLINRIGGRPVDDVLREIGQQRAEAFNRARAVGVDDFSRGKVGNVNAVALDRRTGQIIEGWNGHARDVIPQDRVHPLLADRLEELRDAGPYDVLDGNGNPTGKTMPFPHPDNPLGHAEVKAVNELLRLRGAHADPSVFKEFQVDNFTPFTKKGIEPIPCCANCGSLLAGTPATPGRLGGFPPEHFPRYPR